MNTTINPDKLAQLDTINLAHGAHGSFESGHCAMEVTTAPNVVVLAAKLADVADFLRTLPMDLPEPWLHSYTGQWPGLSWRVDADAALNVIAAIGGTWGVATYDEKPQTIAHTRRGDLSLTVVVEGVNLPDLAIQAVAP